MKEMKQILFHLFFESFGKWFDVKKRLQDSYVEEDDQGRHVHERLRLILRKI